MSFDFIPKRDQALLAKIISLAHEQGKPLGRTALQKILYFLKVLEIPSSYKFNIHHYGPFCSDIITDTENLVIDDVIDEEIVPLDEDKKKYSYTLSQNDAAKNLLSEYDNNFDQTDKEKIENIVKILSSWQPSDLEMIATLHFLYRWLREGKEPPPWKEKVLKSFHKIKPDPDRFPDKKVEEAYQALIKAELIEEDLEQENENSLSHS